MNDAYSPEMKKYLEKQDMINSKISEMMSEIRELPNLPPSIDEWIVSWSDLDNKHFSLSSARKRSEIRKKYMCLIDEAEVNMRRMRQANIDDLISKINETLNGSTK